MVLSAREWRGSGPKFRELRSSSAKCSSLVGNAARSEAHPGSHDRPLLRHEPKGAKRDTVYRQTRRGIHSMARSLMKSIGAAQGTFR